MWYNLLGINNLPPLTHFNPVLCFILKPVIFLQTKANDCFLYQTEHCVETGFKGADLHKYVIARKHTCNMHQCHPNTSQYFLLRNMKIKISRTCLIKAIQLKLAIEDTQLAPKSKMIFLLSNVFNAMRVFYKVVLLIGEIISWTPGKHFLLVFTFNTVDVV